MEENYTQHRQVTFYGEGMKLLGIYLVNALLTIATLGLYYPWAKAALLRYLYEESEFEGSRFTFHGTGREMFIGFIKAIGIFIVIYGVLVACMLSKNMTLTIIGLLFFYGALLLLIPVAVHGSLRYRLSRSSWRGVRFGYRGDLKEFMRFFVKGSILTILTLGIYSFWFIIDIRRYVMKNVRFGNVTFSYKGNGSDFFVLNLKGYLLSLVTLGIYSFWYFRDLFNYYIDNIRMYQDDHRLVFRSTATAGGFFRLLAGNFLIILFTLGIGTPWAICRSLRFVFNNSIIEGTLDTESIRQTEENYKDATGEDLADMIDIGLV
ncbi:YjgN family protein [Dyadobacter sandarakinus]|uniref:DUF898 domain-containing protein n=1 Tax=Dyadobacter sandarakinus TaxID=2747268 RepID=A0ABX7I8G6_9BACT|nr:DUF898 family protein [Dyadobacter sandarakinus]QRR02175.1 DUF898 domain-containing protein [Dyadobacter sandarakinus]